MVGRILIVILLLCAIGAGGAVFYLQEYAYYRDVPVTGPEDVRITTRDGQVQPLPHTAFRATDADSSPIRYRACFTLEDTLSGGAADLSGYEPYRAAEPLVGPRWFDCYDADAIGAALEEGRARAFLSVANVTYGVDRVLAIDSDGRGWVWHQINRCGEEVFDGHPAPEGCPPVPEGVARQ